MPNNSTAALFTHGPPTMIVFCAFISATSVSRIGAGISIGSPETELSTKDKRMSAAEITSSEDESLPRTIINLAISSSMKG